MQKKTKNRPNPQTSNQNFKKIKIKNLKILSKYNSLKNNELMQTAPLLPPIGGCGVLFHHHLKTLPNGEKTLFCGFLYIIYFAHMVQHYFLLFSLFCSFSAFCIHCYFVMFCYSTHYTILSFSFLVLLPKNANFDRDFIILHRHFCIFSKKVHFYFIVFQYITTC